MKSKSVKKKEKPTQHPLASARRGTVINVKPTSLFQNPDNKVLLTVKNFIPKQRKEIENTYQIMEDLGCGTYGSVKRVIHNDLKE